MIVIIAVMIAVTGTVMTTDIPAATDEDKPTTQNYIQMIISTSALCTE